MGAFHLEFVGVTLCCAAGVSLPQEPWLWVLLVISVWHEMEHVSIMSVFLRTGHVGTPGLLARGGAIGGGLPLNRPDLHFFYNLLEELLLIMAYLSQIRRLAMFEEILAPPRTPFVTGT